MPEASIGAALAAAPKALPAPTVGDTHLMRWDAFGGLRQVREGEPYYANGTYIEVEVKEVKTAKVVLE